MNRILAKILRVLGFENRLYAKKYYSQDGEDVLLQSFLQLKNDKGFYIDIGAHHPMRFSNTYIFYKNGWKGINIDATPGSMLKFNKLRKRDINIEAGISDKAGEMDYYIFYEPALNSFDKELSEERINIGWKLKEIARVKTFPINDILGKYLLNNQKIDFITIDVEGLDLAVLQSLNLNKYAPDFFVVEDNNALGKDIMECKESEIYCFLFQKGYICAARTMRSLIFRKAK